MDKLPDLEPMSGAQGPTEDATDILGHRILFVLLQVSEVDFNHFKVAVYQLLHYPKVSFKAIFPSYLPLIRIGLKNQKTIF